MVRIDMASMSEDTRERFEELRSREITGDIDDFARQELEQIRYEFGIDD